MFDYDAELRRYHPRLLQAADINPAARVLDIGCGTGQTTRSAARAAYRGDALGLDISTQMLARARHLTTLDRLTNATFQRGDAQVHPLPPGRFTLAISRFGTMFFADPRAAFTNIARALRPGARFVQLVWQDSRHLEWDTVIRQALTDELGGVPTTPSADAAFSLADPATVHTILTEANFTDVQLAEVHEPVYYGADGASALHALRALRATSELLCELDDTSTHRTLRRLRAILDAHEIDQDDGGVWFDSSAWLITARRKECQPRPRPQSVHTDRSGRQTEGQKHEQGLHCTVGVSRRIHHRP